MGWTGLSVPMDPEIKESKSDFYQTPRIAELAKQGMRFSRAYSPAPMCTPSRASFLTGMSPAKHCMTSPGGNRRTAPSRQKIVPPKHLTDLPEKEKTIAEVLKEKGYASAHFGKWHLKGGGPGKHGFIAHDGDTENGGAGENDDPNPKDIFGITNRAIKFMKEQKMKGKPFYLQLSHYAIHQPHKYLKKTEKEFSAVRPGKRHSSVEYAAIIKDFDTGVGELLDSVKKQGLEKETYVVFMSDNGGGERRPSQGNTFLGGGKASLYEGGIRVPLIISGPGIKKGSFCSVNVVGHDLFPTFCELAGARKSIPEGVEGASLVPLLKGKERSFRRIPQEIVFHFPHYGKGPDQVPMSAIISGDKKLLKNYETNEIMLFDLKKDIGETNDLSKKNPKETEKLHSLLLNYLKRVKAGMPKNNSQYDPKASRPRPNQGRRGRSRRPR